MAEGADGGVQAGDGDGVGGRAERGRDGRLVAGPDADQRGHRAQQPAEPVRRRPAGPPSRPCARGRAPARPAGPPAAPAPRRPRCSAARSSASAASAARDARPRRARRPSSRPGLAGAQPGEPRLQRRRTGAGPPRPRCVGLGPGRGRAVRSPPRRPRPRLRSVFTSPVSRARPSRRSAIARSWAGVAASRPRRARLSAALRRRGRRRRAPAAVRADLGLQRRPRPLRISAASRSIASGSRPRTVLRRRRCRRCAAARPAIDARAGHPLAQPGQRVPGLLGRGQLRQGVAGGAPRRPARPRRACGRGRPRAASRRCLQRGLGGELGLQRAGGRHAGRRRAAGPGVAQLGLDDGRLAGHLGLPAERLELAADLAEQVAEPVEVGLRSPPACAAPSPCACGASGRRRPPR